MKEPNNQITQNFTDYFRAWTNVHVPTVYTNAFSFYETASKLVISLNELRDNQNLTSKQYDSLVEQVIPYLNEVREYMTDWRDDFREELDAYRQDREEYEQKFKEWLKNYYDAFMEALKEKEQEFLNEITKYWGDATTTLTNKLDEGKLTLEAINKRYEDKVETWYNSFKESLTTRGNAITEDYKNLEKQVDNFYTDFTEVVKEALNTWQRSAEEFKSEWELNIETEHTYWLKLAENFYERYKNVANKLLETWDFKESIIKWSKDNYYLFQEETKKLFKDISRVVDILPEDGFEGEVILLNDYHEIGPTVTFTFTRLYRYTKGVWLLITDNNLYITPDNHVYYVAPITNPYRTDHDLTLANSETTSNNPYNTSAWFIPVCYGYDAEKRCATIRNLQQYNTQYYGEMLLNNESHQYSYCTSPRGYGAYNFIYKNINNDFQRVLRTLSNKYIIQTARGIFQGENDFPTLYNNVCEYYDPALDFHAPLNDDFIYDGTGLQVVTGLFHVDEALIYEEASDTYGYIRNKVKTMLPNGYMPRFTYNNKLYCFGDSSVYTIDKSSNNHTYSVSNSSLLTLLNERDFIQIDNEENYIYTLKHVWKLNEVIDAIENNTTIKPILILPKEIEHANIWDGVLYTTHENYVIDLKEISTNAFNKVDVNVHANGIWVPDTSTWRNGYVYGGFYWQFSLINEEDTTNPHETIYNYQNAVIGAKEIEYVRI